MIPTPVQEQITVPDLLPSFVLSLRARGRSPRTVEVCSSAVVLPDTLDEHGGDTFSGDEMARLVFIEDVVDVGTGAPKQARSQRTRREEPAVGQRDDRPPRGPVAAEAQLERPRGRAERFDCVTDGRAGRADRGEQRIAVVGDDGGPHA